MPRCTGLLAAKHECAACVQCVGLGESHNFDYWSLYRDPCRLLGAEDRSGTRFGHTLPCRYLGSNITENGFDILLPQGFGMGAKAAARLGV